MWMAQYCMPQLFSFMEDNRAFGFLEAYALNISHSFTQLSMWMGHGQPNVIFLPSHCEQGHVIYVFYVHAHFFKLRRGGEMGNHNVCRAEVWQYNSTFVTSSISSFCTIEWHHLGCVHDF